MSCVRKSLKNTWERLIKSDFTKAQPQVTVNKLGDLTRDCRWGGRHFYDWIVQKHCDVSLHKFWTNTRSVWLVQNFSEAHSLSCLWDQDVTLPLALSPEIYTAMGPLKSLFRICTLKIKFNLLTSFKSLLDTLLKFLSSKKRTIKFKNYKERKQVTFQTTCEWNLKLVVFKVSLSSFINSFAHSNPQESKTQILTKSLHQTLF